MIEIGEIGHLNFLRIAPPVIILTGFTGLTFEQTKEAPGIGEQYQPACDI